MNCFLVTLIPPIFQVSNYIHFESCWNISSDRRIVYGLRCSTPTRTKIRAFVVGMHSRGVARSNNAKSKKVALYLIIARFTLICLKSSFPDTSWSRIKIAILFTVLSFPFARRNGRDWFAGWSTWIYAVTFSAFLKWSFFL